MKAAARQAARADVVERIRKRRDTAKPNAIGRSTEFADLPQLLRVPEAAAWADCSAGVIYEKVRCGQIASVRLGRLLRIPRSALAAWVGESAID